MRANNWEALPMVLSIKQVAEVLGVSRACVYRMVKDDSLPKIQVGKVNKIYREALRHWLQRTPSA